MSHKKIIGKKVLMVKILSAQIGEELLLSSTNVRPAKLIKAGFKFKYELLEGSLKSQLA